MDQDGAAIIRHDLQLRERVCNLIEEYLITKVSLEESMRQEKELEQQREEERVRLRENAVMSSIVRRLEFVDIQEEEV